MMEWLNTKAALSVAVMVMIGVAGAWYEFQDDRLKLQRLEAELERFVSMVDQVCITDSYVSVDITSSRNADGFFLSPVINGEPYEMTVTQTHARFVQGDIQCTGEFITTIFLMNGSAGNQPGSLVPATALYELNMVKIRSGTSISMIKVIMVSDYRELPAVAILKITNSQYQ